VGALRGERTNKSKYTVDQIEELIKSEAPVMASKDDVIAFLDARNISHSKYKEHKGAIQPEFETDFQDAKIKGNAHLIKYFVFATGADRRSHRETVFPRSPSRIGRAFERGLR